MTPTELALAVDRLARAQKADAIYGTDYSFGPTRPTPPAPPTREENESREDFQARMQAHRDSLPAWREANPPVWEIQTWDEDELGPRPTMQQVEEEAESGLSLAERIKAAEAHVLKYFTPLGVIAAQNKMLTVQQAGTEADYPKLVATYQWLLGVQQQAVEGTNGVFPEPPYTFDEVIAE
jgi:hypothetical protein